ncbi:MAG: hypothetical protein PVG24_14155, partial [Gammaproteobacteria bacterium]
AETVVDRFGGIRPMATKLGIPVTTVQGWRGRRHIPGNRIEEIRRAAAEHGVDLSAGPEAEQPAAPPDTAEPESASETETAGAAEAGTTEPAAAQSPSSQAIAGGSGVAWAALVLAVVALAGVASYRYWAPFVGVAPRGTDASLSARVDALENREAPAPDARVDELAQKVETLSQRVAQRPAAGAGGGKALAAATAELETLRADVDSLTQKAARSETRARAADTETSESLDALRAEIATLKESMSAVDARVKAIEARPPATGGKIAALAIAAGQLETALDSGRPYAGALDRLKALAAGDAAIAAALGKLANGASTGVPTVAALARDFADIAPSLTVPAASEDESGWAATLRAKAQSLINMRPVGDDGDASPVTRAERALARNDLAAAVAALDAVPGDAAAQWRTRARARLDADAAVGAVRARIVDRLASETETAGSANAAPAATDRVTQ